MKKVFLEMYLRKNLGDDLFLQTIIQRYDNVKFYTAKENDYFKDFGFGNVCGRSFLKKGIDGIRSRLLKQGVSNDKKFAAKVILGGSMFIEQGQDKNTLKNGLEKKYNSKIPLFVLGANFGPYDREFYLEEHKKIFARAKDVCFREKYSADLFSDLKNVRVAPDIVFGLDKENYSVQQKKKVVISVINLEKRETLRKYLKAYEDKVAEIANEYAKCGYEVVLMSFCEYEGDEVAIERILEKVSSDKIQTYYYRGDIDGALRQIASAEIVIGTRFHSVVLGLVFEKNLLPIIYSKKTENMLQDIKFEGKVVSLNRISELDVSNIKSYSTQYGSVKKLKKGAEAHFKELDIILNGGEHGIEA